MLNKSRDTRDWELQTIWLKIKLWASTKSSLSKIVEVPENPKHASKLLSYISAQNKITSGTGILYRTVLLALLDIIVPLLGLCWQLFFFEWLGKNFLAQKSWSSNALKTKIQELNFFYLMITCSVSLLYNEWKRNDSNKISFSCSSIFQ